MALDINKLIADAKAARAAFAANKIKADALAKSIKNISDADKKFKTEAQNKLNYANTLQKSLADFEGTLTIFAQQIARDGKLNPVDQKEFNRILFQYKKTDITYKTTIKQANAILAKATTPVIVKTENGKAVIPPVAKSTDKKADDKTVEKKPDDFDALLKTATEYITKLKGSDRKFLAQSLNDALGLKLPVSASIDPQVLLAAYRQAIGGAKSRYNIFKDVYTVGEYLSIKKIETAAAKKTEEAKAPDITDYPVISSPTDVKKLINSVFQTNLNRDATAAEIKLLSPLLKDAQLNNPTYYKKKTLNGKVAQIQYSGLDSGQWILDQITSNTSLNLKSELDTAKTQDPDLTKRLANKKIYDKLIADAKGDPTKITIANETTVYGRGLKELLALVQATADANGATNTPEELTKLAETLYDKGIAANSFQAQAEMDKVFKTGSGLVKNKAEDVIRRLADKKIYDKLIADAAGDATKIAEANDTTAYGRGLKEMLTDIETQASDKGAINTPEELRTLATNLYSKGILLGSAEGLKAVNAVLKNNNGLIKGQPADLVKLAADKKIYDTAIAAAAGDPAKIEAANKGTTYGRGLKEILSIIQLTAKANGATNTPEELSALATKLYDQGLSIDSAEASIEIDNTLKSSTGLIKDKAASLKIIAANKAIYDKLIADAKGDPAKIAAANETTEYGRGLKNILTALQTKAKNSGAINTPEELATLAKSLYDKGIDLNSNEGAAAVDAVLKTKDGLVSEQGTDLIKLAADKKIYDKLIADAKGDPVKIAAANDTTDYGRGLKNIVTALQIKAKNSGAINTPEELATLAKKLYDQGLTLDSAEGIAAVNAVLKTEGGLVSDQPVDLIKLAADKKIYDKLIVAAAGDPDKIAAARDTTEYGRGLKEIIGALQAQAKDSAATNTTAELEALAQKLYDKGVSLNSDEGIVTVGAVLKNKNGLIKDQPADLVKIAADKKIYDDLVESAAGDLTAIAKAKTTTAYGRGLASVEAALKSKLLKGGATNTAEEITALAQDLYDNGINPLSSEGLAKINSSLKYAPDATTGKYTGTAGTTIAELQATATANGLDIQGNFGNQISGWLTAIDNGEQIDNIKQKIRDVAKLGQPESIKKLIDNGNDLETIYAPYKNTMASVLEIQDTNTIKLDDPTLRMAITSTGELNLYDYKKALRKDNRWQYTQTANQEVSDTTQRVLRDFGFMG